jgi:hypothetical protein
MNPILPIIHINGTSKQSLCEDYQLACASIDDAVRAIENIEFHARDYARGVWPDAVAERGDIYSKLAEVREFLMTHATHLS